MNSTYVNDAKVKVRMGQLGLTRSALAREMGVSRSLLSQLLNYSIPLSPTMAGKIAVALDLAESDVAQTLEVTPRAVLFRKAKANKVLLSFPAIKFFLAARKTTLTKMARDLGDRSYAWYNCAVKGRYRVDEEQATRIAEYLGADVSKIVTADEGATPDEIEREPLVLPNEGERRVEALKTIGLRQEEVVKGRLFQETERL